MAYQRVPETVEIALIFEAQNQEIRNLFYAQKVGGYSQTDIDGLAAAVDSSSGPQFAALMSTRDHYVRTDVRGLDAENDLTSSVATSTTAGSTASIGTPLSVAFCVRQRSGLTGRSALGRVYIGNIPLNNVNQADASESYIKSANADAWVAVVDGVRITIDNFGTWDPVLVSRYHDGVKRAEAVVFPWLSTDYSTLRLASRRSRLP